MMAQPRNPLIALVLSLLFPGLGQVYVGETNKGVAFIVLGVVFLFLSIFLIGIPLFLILWLYGMYDAYRSAERSNAAHAGGPAPMPMAAPPPPPGYVPPPPAGTPSGAMSSEVFCPTCGLRFLQGAARFCPEDATPLRAVA